MESPAQKRPVKEDVKEEEASSSETGTNINTIIRKRCKMETAVESVKEEAPSSNCRAPPSPQSDVLVPALPPVERDGRETVLRPRVHRPDQPLSDRTPVAASRLKRGGGARRHSRPRLPEPTWEEVFFELVLFRSRNGSCEVPSRTSVTTMGGAGRRIKLGQWVSRMRTFRRLLDDAAAGVEGREYFDEAKPEDPPEGNTGVDEEDATGATTASEESARLASLAMTTKAASVLTPDRIEALDSLEFRWESVASRTGGQANGRYKHSQWEAKYDELRRFKEEHGHCGPEEKGPLKRWISQQRLNNSTVSGTIVMLGRSARRCAGLTAEVPEESRRRIAAKSSGAFSRIWAERKARLDELGFVWSKRDRASWEERFEQLKAYKAEHGNCHVPQHYSLNRPLGKWVNRNRTEYTSFLKGKKCVINQERIDLLESIGFEWTIAKKGRPRTCDSAGREIEARAGEVAEPSTATVEAAVYATPVRRDAQYATL